MRAAFLTGQLQQERGEYHQAAESFENVLAFYPKIDMDFYTRKRIAYNSLLAGDDAASAMRPLKKVLNDGKYVTFYDQVYFVLGKLAIQAGKTDEAIDYLNKSIATPKATKKQKAMSFAALGDAYYADTKYKLAKLSYDSAAKYNTPASKDTTGLSNISRAKTLNDIVAPATVIHDEDSLLALSLLSKKDQLAAVRRYLKYLEQNRDDSVTAAENAILNSFSTPESGAESPSDYGSWYFSNPSLVQQGSSDFKRKWGNRTLTDNWRRSAGNAFNNSSNDEVQETDASDEKGANGLPSEKSLLAKIPNTPDQKIRAEQAEQKAYIQLAKAYYNLFDDYGNAIATLDKLDEKVPDHDQKLDDLYLRYQIAIKQGKLEIAQKYANTIVKDFPDSDYAKLLKPREGSKSESQLTKVTVEKYYDSTYNLLLTRQYSDALVHIDVAKKQFDNPVFHKRFLVAEAMALAGMGDFDKADTAIQAFLHTYPGHDTLSDWARSIKEYIGDMRKTGMPSWYKPSPPGSKEKAAGDSTKATSDSAHIAAAGPAAPKPDPIPETPAMYQNHPADQHYCIVILPGIDSRMPELRKKIQSFDSARFADGHLDIILDYFDMDKTVMVVKKFANAGTAQTYMSTLQSSDCFSAFAGTEFKPMIISAANYRKLFADKNIAAYISFYDAVYLK